MSELADPQISKTVQEAALAKAPDAASGQPLELHDAEAGAETRGRGRRSRWYTLGVIALSLFFSLLLAEALVRAADGLGLVDLSPSLAELPAAAGSLGEDQVSIEASAGQTSLYVSDPALHHRMAANWAGFFPEEITRQVGRSKVPIRTNSLGLRSPEVALAKPKDTFRILVLGDSVTFGWGIRNEDGYASQLASLLTTMWPDKRFEVINAGVSGYGTWQEALWLDETGRKLSPDVIVVQVHLNDAADNLWGTLSPGASSGGSWLARHSMLYRLVSRVAGGDAPSGILDQAGAAPCIRDWKVDTQRVCWELTEELLGDIQKTASALGAKAVLMPSPMRWQVEPGVRDPRAWVDAGNYQEPLTGYAHQNGWLVVDPLPAVRAASESGAGSLFLDVGHPNEGGQRILAEQLYNALDQAGVLP